MIVALEEAVQMLKKRAESLSTQLAEQQEVVHILMVHPHTHKACSDHRT